MDKETSTHLFYLYISLLCIASKFTITGTTGSCLTPSGTKICCLNCFGYHSTCWCSPNCHKMALCCSDYDAVCNPVTTTMTTTTTTMNTTTTIMSTTFLVSTSTIEEPGPVTNLSVSSVTTNCISLTWDAVPNVDSYKVYGEGLPPEGEVVNTTSLTICNLESGSNNTFTVVAVARDGVTVGPPAMISAFTQPGPVTNLSVSSLTKFCASLFWNLVSNADSYIVFGYALPSEGKIVNMTTITICNLVPGRNYSYTVAAIAQDGVTEGPPTNISFFMPITRSFCASRLKNQCCPKPEMNCKSLDKKCSCDSLCPKFGDCCEDYYLLCQGV